HARVQQLPQRLHVGGLPRDDPAGGVGLVELEVLLLREAEDLPPQREQHPLADDDGLAHVPEGQHAADDRGGDGEGRRLEGRPRIAVQQRGQAVVDAPGDDRGACDDGELRDDDHHAHHHELTLDRGEQLAEQGEGALAGGLRLLGGEGPAVGAVLIERCGGGHRPSSWMARSSSSPVSVSMSWSRRRSSSWFAITQRYRAEVAMSSVWVPTATIRPPSSRATRSASATVEVRWATISVVVPFSTSRSRPVTVSSVFVSSAESGSSSNSTAGFAAIARAS